MIQETQKKRQTHFVRLCYWRRSLLGNAVPDQSESSSTESQVIREYKWILWDFKLTWKVFSAVQHSFMCCTVCMYMFLSDVVIPESPEAFLKLTEQTLRSSAGRQQQSQKSGTHSLVCCLIFSFYSQAESKHRASCCDRRLHFLTLLFWFVFSHSIVSFPVFACRVTGWCTLSSLWCLSLVSNIFWSPNQQHYSQYFTIRADCDLQKNANKLLFII